MCGWADGTFGNQLRGTRVVIDFPKLIGCCLCFFFIAGHCESFTADFHRQLSRKFTYVRVRWCAKAKLLNELSVSQINLFLLLFPLSLKKPQNPPLPWFLSCKSTLTLATDIPRWEFPFIQERFWVTQDIMMQFVLIICTLIQFYISMQVPCSWTRVESARLVFNMYFYSALIVFVLSPGAKAGVEGNQRTARPSLSLHELPEARRGCSCAPVLPCSR